MPPGKTGFQGMFKFIAAVVAFLASAVPLHAEVPFPLGTFQVVNTAGFIQKNGERTQLPADEKTGTATLSDLGDGKLALDINGARIVLFPVKNGLAALEWDAQGTALLHDIDIQALIRENDRHEIPVWGAKLDWPQEGSVEMVLLPLGDDAVTGFLVSHPKDLTVVRQMEFHQVFGPEGRPQISADASNPDE